MPLTRLCRNFCQKLAEIMAPKCVFVLGTPGAGKGTVCEQITKDFGYVHLSAGELLRQERANPLSKSGKLIDDYIKEGKIVPVAITCQLLADAMKKSGKERFLIDGFPRNQDNLNGWEKEMKDKVDLQFVLYLDCPEKVGIERCLGRGAAGSGRSDDNVESLKKRFVTYVNETRPIIDFYSQKHLVRKVDTSKCADEVILEVKQLFREYFEHGV